MLTVVVTFSNVTFSNAENGLLLPLVTVWLLLIVTFCNTPRPHQTDFPYVKLTHIDSL
jgi:hypothetical protein